ncbi:hypothetical protein F2Q70_00033583 [Brassica cretica]|uniref:ABC transporter domain-containing protein n=1 Tax=Brassica cretica TaxID=69181 RepID=A0A8S9FI21_BRACR|nr:hypothetical protein F2Q70_00033583 [Brassica cretica]
MSKEQQLEGEYRKLHSRLRTHSESIAFYGGETREESHIQQKFKNLVSHMSDVLHDHWWFGMIQDFLLKYLGATVAVILIIEPFFSGHLRPDDSTLGRAEMLSNIRYHTSVIISLFQALGTLSISSRRLSRLSGYADRIHELMAVSRELSGDDRTSLQRNRSRNYLTEANYVEFSGVKVVTPTGNVLVEDLTLRVEQGSNLLITGPNGSGKSSLFRVLGGLWPLVSGHIVKPGVGSDLNKEIFYVPQRPYMAVGTLRDQLIYPLTSDQETVPLTETGMVELLENVGPNGSGKSSLFRVLGGLWPLVSGHIVKPGVGSDLNKEIFYVPQRPYMAVGTLRDQLIYPLTSDQETVPLTETGMVELLENVDLEYLLDRYQPDKEVNWGDELSLGEQQRLGMARLFYHKPKFAILDECTSAVTTDMEERFAAKVRAMGTSCITISHRPALVAFHDVVLSLDGEGGWSVHYKRDDSALQTDAGVDSVKISDTDRQNDAMVVQRAFAAARKESATTNSKAQAYLTQLMAKSPVVDKSVVLPRFPQPQTSPKALPLRVAAMLNTLIPTLFDKQGGQLLLVACLVVSRTLISDRIASLNGTTVKYVLEQDKAAFVRLIGLSVLQSSASSVIAPSLKHLTQRLALGWRIRLTQHLLRNYLRNNAFYKVFHMSGNSIDADQRLTRDLEKLTTDLSGLLTGMVKPSVDILWFTWRMKLLTGQRGVAILYTYMLLGLGFLRHVAPDFGDLAGEEQQLEGKFRFMHERLNTHAESIAFFGGGAREKAMVDTKFRALLDHSLMLLKKKWLYGILDDFVTKQLPNNVTWGLSLLYALEHKGDRALVSTQGLNFRDDSALLTDAGVDSAKISDTDRQNDAMVVQRAFSAARKESATTNSKAQAYLTQLITKSPVVDKSVVLPRFPQPKTSPRALPLRIAAMLHTLLPWKANYLFHLAKLIRTTLMLKVADHFTVMFQIPTLLDKQGGQLLLVACLVVSRTLISDRIASLNGTTVKYVLEQDKAAFVRLIGLSVIQSSASAIIAPSLKHLTQRLALGWRIRLTQHLLRNYLRNNAFYKVFHMSGNSIDADQRLTRDLEKLTTDLSGLLTGMVKPSVDILWFTWRMKLLTGQRGVAILYTYMLLGLGFLRHVAPDFGDLAGEEQQLEGKFRFMHERLNTHAESIAFFGGGAREKAKAYVTLKHPLSISSDLFPVKFIEEDRKSKVKGSSFVEEEGDKKSHWLDQKEKREIGGYGGGKARRDGGGGGRVNSPARGEAEAGAKFPWSNMRFGGK